MSKITIDSLGSTINWAGPGTYTAQRMRGPLDFEKLPKGSTAQNSGSVVVRDFASKPAPVDAPQRTIRPKWG